MINVTASYIPQNIFFWRLEVIARPLLCWQQDFLLLICRGIYPQIYDRTPCPAVLICNCGSKKSKGGIGLFQISQMQKERLLMTTKLLLGVISQCGFQDKGLPLPFSLAKKKIYLDTQLKADLTNLFSKLPRYSLFPHRQRVNTENV